MTRPSIEDARAWAGAWIAEGPITMADTGREMLKLIAHTETLEARIDAALELHRPSAEQRDDNNKPYRVCVHCTTTGGATEQVRHPCPTVQALEGDQK